ncbi:MAG: methionyl-tRNA formyltransferase, partial [Cytophagaceae bacterium BCCC1]
MGTPDFAVATLQRLVENGFEVVAAITAPDKPVGRGQKMSESPVKKYALSQGIPVLQPEKLKNKDFLEELATYKADLQVVVAFRMLPEAVWAMPKMGTINLHGSLLPQYRGAAPINWAVINGETLTGVTTFFIEKEIDTGNIIFSENIEIKATDTAGDLHDRMMWIGGDLMVKTVKAIASGVYPSEKQDFSQELKPAPKIFKETCKIDWQKD